MHWSTLLLTILAAATAMPATMAYSSSQYAHCPLSRYATHPLHHSMKRYNDVDVFARDDGNREQTKWGPAMRVNGGGYHPPRPLGPERPFYHGDRHVQTSKSVKQKALQGRGDREAIALFARSAAEALLDALD